MNDDVSKNIRDILDDLPGERTGLSLDEIYGELLVRMGRLDMALVKEAVYRMVEEQSLEEHTAPTRPNETLYHLWHRLPSDAPQQMSLFDYIVMKGRDEIEREAREKQDLWLSEELEREFVSQSVLQQIAAGHVQETAFAEEIRKVAVALANENPVELLLEMAEWVIDDLNGLMDRLADSAQSNAEEFRRLKREFGFRSMKAKNFFQRLWRMDSPIDGSQGIMFLPNVRHIVSKDNVRKPIRAWFDKDRARERLEKRVFGERVIEIIEMPPNMHRAAIGTDASVGDVRVRHKQGSFIPPTPAVLFVASAAMRTRDQTTTFPYWDFDISPRELERFEDVEAAEEGLLISPRLRSEVTDFRHLRSAAMELRQYKQELRVLQKEANWRPVGNVQELGRPPTPTLLIRDGRVFPLVHRLADYDGASAPDDFLYGVIVRREIEAFHRVFLNSAGSNFGSTYGGTVKSPEFSWFSMLAFWYLHVKRNKQQFENSFYRPILTDQAVTHLLFWGLVESDPSILEKPRNVLLTFRAVRRFCDIAFWRHPLPIIDDTNKVRRIVDENDPDDWKAYIEQYIRDADFEYERNKRGVPSLGSVDEYNPFLELCHRAGVAMFYSAPARMYEAVMESSSHFLTPRWELAVDISTLDNPNLLMKMEKLFAWLVDEGGLVRDQSHAIGGFEEAEEGLPLFIPDVVMEAHETVVFTQQRHVPEVEDMLQQLIQDIRHGRLPSIRT